MKKWNIVVICVGTSHIWIWHVVDLVCDRFGTLGQTTLKQIYQQHGVLIFLRYLYKTYPFYWYYLCAQTSQVFTSIYLFIYVFMNNSKVRDSFIWNKTLFISGATCVGWWFQSWIWGHVCRMWLMGRWSIFLTLCELHLLKLLIIYIQTMGLNISLLSDHTKMSKIYKLFLFDIWTVCFKM